LSILGFFSIHTVADSSDSPQTTFSENDHALLLGELRVNTRESLLITVGLMPATVSVTSQLADLLELRTRKC
jgi:hypothetical protein